MINIVSTQAEASRVTGPRKVYVNLIKGLDRIGYPYVVNRGFNATTRVWVQDDVGVLRYLQRCRGRKVIGPNLYAMPGDVPQDVRIDGALYLQPSPQTVALWADQGFDRCPMAAWPVGIDTDEFAPSSVSSSRRCVLVYHKERDLRSLVDILETLHEMGLKYQLVLYGSYSEDEYKKALARTSFAIWHGCHESQGIALQEALSCNVPLLVCDVSTLADDKSAYRFPESALDSAATAAHYFDGTCGIKITALKGLREAVTEMRDRVREFRPREFVLKNLSLEGQALAFVHLWDRWGLTVEDGRLETIGSSKPLSEPFDVRVRDVASRIGRRLGRGRG